jgi:hypothetical protein
VLNGRDYSIAGKTFEYFKAQKPILAFVTNGAQKDILKDSGIALILDPDNTTEAVSIVKDFFEGKKNLSPNLRFINKHSRNYCSKQLISEFESFLQTKPVSY